MALVDASHTMKRHIDTPSVLFDMLLNVYTSYLEIFQDVFLSISSIISAEIGGHGQVARGGIRGRVIAAFMSMSTDLDEAVGSGVRSRARHDLESRESGCGK